MDNIKIREPIREFPETIFQTFSGTTEFMIQEENNSQQEVEQTSIHDYLQEEVPETEVQALQLAQQCASLFPLFKELARTNLSDFLMKIAILLQLSQNQEKVYWTPQEIATEFHWIRENLRKRLIQQLSRSGWLEYEEGSYKLTIFGKTILSILDALPKQQEQLPDSLGANVSSLSMAEVYQSDPTNSLRMFLNELVRVDESIVNTLQSNSEYLIGKLNHQVRSQFNVAVKSREYMENLPNRDFESYRLKQQIHEKLSAFHARVSHVQRAQNDLVARKIVLADHSLTQHDVDNFLINASLEKLAEIGKNHIAHPIAIRDVIPPLTVYETEWYFERNRPQEKKRGFSEVEDIQEGEQQEAAANNRFVSFASEVNHRLQHKEALAIEKFIPHENWGSSAFRFSMLAALEGGELPAHLKLEHKDSIPGVRVNYDTLPEELALPAIRLNDPISGVKEITKGSIVKRNTQDE